MPLRSCLAVLFLCSLLTGCSSPGDTEVNNVQQGTYGQQLLDLKKAYDSGVISEREYNKARDNILDKMND